MSLTEAANAAKRTRQCLSSAIKKGRLSASKDANGEWKIDSAELLRVYPDCSNLIDKKAPTLHPVDRDGANEVEILRAKLEASEGLRRAEAARAEELRAERDAWKQQAERLLLALPAGQALEAHKTTATESQAPPNEEKPGKRGFWSRLFGGE